MDLPILCDYVDPGSFKGNKNSFSLFHLNIASLTKHKDELDLILKSLNHEFDFIGISETKLLKQQTIIPKKLDITGYEKYSTPTEADKGGTMLYVKTETNHKERKDLNKICYKSMYLESTFIEVINQKQKNLLVGCIYKHPSMDINEFNDDFMNQLFEKLNKENKEIFLMGDFNIDLMTIDDDPNITNYFDIITSNLFIPHIIYPTRITPTSKTLIDNIFSNLTNFDDAISGNLTISISDHLAQFLIISKKTKTQHLKSNIYKSDYKKFDRENFLSELLNIDWTDITKIQNKDCNESLNIILTKINELTDKYLPIKKLNKQELKKANKPWITNGIINSMLRRDKLYKKYIQAKNLVIKEDYHNKYKTLRNQIVTLGRESKNNYYRCFFTENANDIKNTWRGIREIIDLRGKTKNNLTSLMINKELINNPTKIANEFNNYFSTIAENLQKNIYSKDENFEKYLKNKNNKSIFLTPTDKHEVLETINKIITKKAYGPHSIPFYIFHLIKYNISEILAEIINCMFETGTYCDILKFSKVIPIFKEKGSKLECKNYRPISLLSNMNKIIEKLIYKRLIKFFDINKCIYNNQFGFRTEHSTIHALTSLTEDIRSALDENKIVCGLFIDLQKAFDTVNHKILLKKLEHYGVRGIPNKLLESYLTNRKQSVSINGVTSNNTNINCGVPQGSVLGPLLFLIYINDLNLAIKYCTTRHFADDTNLLIKNSSPKKLKKYLNLDLKSLVKWLKVNKISLNTSKTEFIIFKHPNKKIEYDFKIKIDGKRLNSEKFVKYLGIYLDSQLNWAPHTEILSIKLNRAVGMLKKIRHYVPRNVLHSIYYGIFSSLLSYGAQIWGQSENKYIGRIIKIQNKALRAINFANYNDSVDPLYRASNILKFTDNVKVLNFLNVLDSLKNKLPITLSKTFMPVQEVHSYNTRGVTQRKIAVPRANTQTYGIMSITYQSLQFWNFIVNKFPQEKLFEQSKPKCKTFLKKYFLDTYAT